MALKRVESSELGELVPRRLPQGNGERMRNWRQSGNEERQISSLSTSSPSLHFLFFLSFPLISSNFLSIYGISRECHKNLNIRIMRK